MASAAVLPPRLYVRAALTVSAFMQLVAAFALEAVPSAKEGLRRPIRALASAARRLSEKINFLHRCFGFQLFCQRSF